MAKVRKGWLLRQMERLEREYPKWPAWKKEALRREMEKETMQPDVRRLIFPQALAAFDATAPKKD